jgi:hypothetical protein
LPGWLYWRHRLARRECWLGLVRHLGTPTHYTFVSTGGPGLRMLSPIIHDGSCIIGPCFTDASARGLGQYGRALQSALGRAASSGFAWAYIHANVDNEASLRVIRKIPAFRSAGRLLCRRPPLRPYQVVAMDTFRPELVRASNQ